MGVMLVRASQLFILRAMEQDVEYHFKVKRGLPPGARFLYMFQNGHIDTSIVIEHPSFPALELGDVIPEFKLEFERLKLDSE